MDKPPAKGRGRAARSADGAALRSLPPAIVLYDGSCGMCTSTMEKGKRYQRPGALEWIDNSSDEGQTMLAARGLLGKERDSLVVLEGDRTSLGSSAVVRSALHLRWPWKAYAAIWIVPRPLRDAVYRRIGRNRSRHAGCRLPTAPRP